jgi:MYXO-CTERM domain-containing protein
MARLTARCIGYGAFAVLTLALAACTNDQTPIEQMGEPAAGAIRGELTYNVATYDNGTSETQYFLHPAGRPDDELRLLFDSEPDLASGTKLDAWVSRENDGYRVRRFEVLPVPTVAEVQQPLAMGMPFPARSFAFVLVHTGTPPAMPLTQAAAQEKLFGTTPGARQPSVRQYYVEASYGTQDISGQIVGPLDFAMTGCNTSALATALRPMIPGTFQHYLWYIEPRNAGCGWSGLASSGTPAKPRADTWYNSSSGCVVLVQEPGHNFGMAHSSAMKCMGGAAPFADVPMGNCVHSEYGDRFDPMGGGCFHMNAFQKAYEGWFSKCNLVTTPVDSTFTILPLETPCDGVQAVSVPFPKIRPFTRSGGGGSASTDSLSNYVIEMRSGIGIDKSITQPVVQIRAASDLRERTQRGLHTWFLDMKPATPALDGLSAGESFSDPTGSPTITVVSLDNTKAVVKVSFMGGGTGTPTCLDDTPFTGPGAGPESCVGPSVPMGQPSVNFPDAGAPIPPRSNPDGAAARDSAAPGTPTPPTGGPGSGSPDAGASGPAEGPGSPPLSSPGKADASTVNGPVTVSSGCGCRLGGQDRGAPAGAVFVAVGLVGLLARRRRR